MYPDVDQGCAFAGVDPEDEACARGTCDEIGTGCDSDLVDQHERVEVGDEDGVPSRHERRSCIVWV